MRLLTWIYNKLQRLPSLGRRNPRNQSDAAIETATTASYLLCIPDDLLVLVLELLDHRDLSQLVVCSRTNAWQSIVGTLYREQSRLVIPPDSERNHALVTALRGHLQLHTRFTVENPDSLTTLQAICHRVQSLTIQQEWLFTFKYFSPETHDRLRSFHLESLSRLHFCNLTELEITEMKAREPVDLQHIYDGAPQLERLTLSESRATQNRHVLRKFTQLRAVTIRHTKGVRIRWDLGDFVGMPVLEELCMGSPRRLTVVCNASALAQMSPLRVFRFQGEWEENVRPTDDAWRVHFATLETLRLYDEVRYPLSLLCEAPRLTSVEADIDFTSTVSLSPPLTMSRLATTLQTLRLHWRQDVIDLKIIATLTALQHLTVYVPVPEHATHCRELRKLRNLHTLEITDGWLRDFISYLPKLRVLRCRESIEPSPRTFAEPVDAREVFESPVRRAVVEGDVALTPYMVRVLQYAQDVGVVARDDPDLSCLWRLAHIRRLVLESSDDPQLLCQLVEYSQSLRTLEELHIFNDANDEDESLVVPAGIVRATRLRVLELNDPDSLEHIATLTHLERLYIFDARFSGGLKPLLSLHNLLEVAISTDFCCRPLRKARGRRGALPMLQRIFHPIADCLVSPTCCRRHETESSLDLRANDHTWPKWMVEM